MKSTPVLKALLSLALAAAPLTAQSDTFTEPGLTGVAQYSEWDSLSCTSGASLDHVWPAIGARLELAPAVPPEIVGTTLEGGEFTVTFATVQGQLYRLMVSTDLTFWNQVGVAVAGDGANHSISDPDGFAGGTNFYRVETK